MTAATVLNAAAIVVAALLAIIGTLLGLVLRNTRRSAKGLSLVHEQVANNHIDENGNPINMRDEVTESFAGLAKLVKGVAAEQRAQRADIGGLRGEVRQIRADATLDREAALQDRTTVREAAATATKAAEVAAKATADAFAALEQTKNHLKPKE